MANQIKKYLDAAANANQVTVKIGGQLFKHWKSVNVMTSLSELSKQFSLEIADDANAPSLDPYQLVGESCLLFIGETLVLTGYVDKFSGSASAAGRTLTLAGRCKTADLVDCSTQTLMAERTTLIDLANQVFRPFGISATSKTIDAIERATATPGETCFSFVNRYAAAAGALLRGDPDGNVEILKLTAEHVGALLSEKNTLAASISFDVSNRFQTVKAIGQRQGGLLDGGQSVSAIESEAKDPGVTRFRPLSIVADQSADQSTTKNLADWDIQKRVAKSFVLSANAFNWEFSAGKIWQPGQLCDVTLPKLGINQKTMLIQSANFQMGPGGTTTSLELIQPRSFDVVAIKKTESFLATIGTRKPSEVP